MTFKTCTSVKIYNVDFCTGIFLDKTGRHCFFYLFLIHLFATKVEMTKLYNSLYLLIFAYCTYLQKMYRHDIIKNFTLYRADVLCAEKWYQRLAQSTAWQGYFHECCFLFMRPMHDIWFKLPHSSAVSSPCVCCNSYATLQGAHSVHTYFRSSGAEFL